MNRSKPIIKLFFIICIGSWLSACGGGGGGSTDSSDEPAEASWNQSNWDEKNWQ